MKKCLFALFLALLATVSLHARQRAYGYCQQGGKVVVTSGISSVTLVQGSYPQCTLTVYLTGTLTLATLYADNSGTPLGNPFTADSTGYWFFYADNGRYDVRASGGGIAIPFTWGDILLADPVTGFNVDWVTQINNLPVNDSRKFNFPPIAPGGSLTAALPAFATLTPCPSGINSLTVSSGSVIYLSGGVGTAEYAAVTSYSAGTGNCQIGFTPANNHSSGWTISSGSQGIQEAINALPSGYTGGGTVILPCGLLNVGPIGIGNGTSSAMSTLRNVVLRGCAGQGATSGELGPSFGGTTLVWNGATNGAMVTVEGPITGVGLYDMNFSCGTAQTAVQVLHSINGNYQRLSVNGCSYFGITDTSYSTLPAGVAVGGTHNLFSQITIDSAGVSTASGILVGPPTYGTGVDVAREHFSQIDVLCKPGGTGIGFQLQFTDAGQIDQWESDGCANDLFIFVPSGQPGTNFFPDAYSIRDSYLLGANSFLVGGAGNWKPLFPIYLSPLNANTLPAYGSGFSGFQGQNSGGLQSFGYPIGQYSGTDVASASTITPTGGQFRVTGTTTVDNISLPYTGFEGCLNIIPTGALPFSTGGNIATAFTATANTGVQVCYIASASKWYINSGTGGGSGTPGPTGPAGAAGATGPAGPASAVTSITADPTLGGALLTCTNPSGPGTGDCQVGVDPAFVGPSGPTGPAGVTGPTGPAGGPVGPTGPTGAIGPTGPANTNLFTYSGACTTCTTTSTTPNTSLLSVNITADESIASGDIIDITAKFSHTTSGGGTCGACASVPEVAVSFCGTNLTNMAFPSTTDNWGRFLPEISMTGATTQTYTNAGLRGNGAWVVNSSTLTAAVDPSGGCTLQIQGWFNSTNAGAEILSLDKWEVRVYKKHP